MSIHDKAPWKWVRKPSATDGEYHPIQTQRKILDRLFDYFFSDLDINPFARGNETHGWMTPRIDVSENDEEYSFSVKLRGIDEKDLEVFLSEGVLTIKGEKKSDTKVEWDHFLHAKRHYGAFRRSFSLPSDIDEETVEASFKKGVLTVTVAKSAATKPATKRIEISKAA